MAGFGCVIALVVAIGGVRVLGGASEHLYTADMSEAGFIRVGDDVRVAGIPVGEVRSLSLRSDRVRVEFSVADTVFVGSRTTLAVRMLTVVGGYYLAVLPDGAEPLGSDVIAPEQVRLPYNLTQVFQDAIEPVRRIDSGELRRSLDAVATSLDAGPGSLAAVLDATQVLATTLDRQNADISRTLTVADEYLTAMDANTETMGRLLSTFATLETIIADNHVQVGRVLDDLAAVLHGLTPLGRAWDASLRERAQPLAAAVPRLEELAARLGALLESLRSFEQRLLTVASPQGGLAIDQSAATLRVGGICVPIPGGNC
nr:MlaD family protein [Nocardia bovistercoris]